VKETDKKQKVWLRSSTQQYTAVHRQEAKGLAQEQYSAVPKVGLTDCNIKTARIVQTDCRVREVPSCIELRKISDEAW
jgi:hypothetical protein